MFLIALRTHSAGFNICRLAVSFYPLTLTVAFGVWLLSLETPSSGVKRFIVQTPHMNSTFPPLRPKQELKTAAPSTT